MTGDTCHHVGGGCKAVLGVSGALGKGVQAPAPGVVDCVLFAGDVCEVGFVRGAEFQALAFGVGGGLEYVEAVEEHSHAFQVGLCGFAESVA